LSDTNFKKKFFSIVLVLFLVGSSCLPPTFVLGNDPEEDPGMIMENFTLYDYGTGDKALSWELSGNRGRRTSNGLLVSGFKLKVKRSDQLVAKLSGKKLRLEENEGEQIAYMPVRVNLKFGDQMAGSADNARYYFSKNRFSGGGLSLTKTGEFGKIKLTGTRFSYFFDSEELTVNEGFELDSYAPNGVRTNISGNVIKWPTGEMIEMSGEVTASLSSGWRLKAERLVWDTDKGLLESSGSASASRDGTQIEGDAINYESEEEKLVVFDGRITREEG
jgi:lipopolysaccharide export system protein LptA